MPINNYLNQTATLKPKTGNTLEGKPSFGDDVSIKVRFQDTQKRLTDGNGVEYYTDAEFWGKPTQSLNLGDVVVFGGVNYKIVKIETKRGLAGKIHHKKALVVKTKE